MTGKFLVHPNKWIAIEHVAKNLKIYFHSVLMKVELSFYKA